MVGQFSVRVWAILGDGSTGKSTVIGILTSQLGRGGGGFRHVLLRGGGYLYIYARRQSVQEAKRSPDDVVRDTVRLARRQAEKSGFSTGYLNLLLALRTDRINSLPPASGYLSHFVKAGWGLESLVILDFDYQKHARYYEFGAPTYEHESASKMVRNKFQHQWLAGQVRNHFQWA